MMTIFMFMEQSNDADDTSTIFNSARRFPATVQQRSVMSTVIVHYHLLLFRIYWAGIWGNHFENAFFSINTNTNTNRSFLWYMY